MEKFFSLKIKNKKSNTIFVNSVAKRVKLPFYSNNHMITIA